jgi:hypothetical protein
LVPYSRATNRRVDGRGFPIPGSRIKELVPMSFVRSALLSAAVAGLVMSAGGLAQAQDASKDSSIRAKVESKAEDVAKWSTKEWNKAKAQWAKEKDKWADCQKQSKDQGLSGRKSWSFLASCMTST